MVFDVIEFFERFGDHTEELYSGMVRLSPPLREICPAGLQLLGCCTTNQLKIREAGGLFALISSLETLDCDETSRAPTFHFGNPDAFCIYPDKARKITV